MYTINIPEQLAAANKELAFIKTQNQKLIAKLVAANKELAFQNEEKAKRADELKVANKELLIQNKEKRERAAELTIADLALLFHTADKEKRAAAFAISEDELKKMESQFQLMVNNVKDYAIFMLDAHGRVSSWNSGAQYMKGYSEDEIIGKPVDIFYTQDAIDSGEPIKNLQLALQYEHYETEGLRVRKDGTRFYANAIFIAITDGNGKLYGYAKITKDISDIKKNEQELKKLNAELEQRILERTEKLTLSEAFNAGVLNSLTSHIAVLAENGDIIAVNDEWKRFAKENGDAILQNTGVGSNYYTVCKKAAKENIEQANVVAKGIKEIMDGKMATFYMEYACHSPTKQQWFAMRVVKFENNHPMAVVTHHNITERKQAEEEMLRLASRLLLATDSVQLGIWEWDIISNVHIWNNYMYSIYNIDKSEFNPFNEEWLTKLHPEDKQRVGNEMQLALEGKQIYRPEFRIVWADSSVHYIKASGIVERDGAGNATRMIGANWDITEQKAAEK